MSECPSAERLASNEMTPEERATWLDHAAACSQCHAIAMVMSSSPGTGGPAEASERIGRFVLGRELGRGAMGTVYAAEDPELARPIALKVLHDATAADRLRREARALARLDHPNVVRVYDVGMTGEHAFVAMELIAGENLRHWLQAEPRKLPEIVDVLVQAGRGLAAAHAAGIVHRDFKPDNVLVAPGRVVVGDFGLSRLGGELGERTVTSSLDVISEDKLTVTGAVIGTPAYMAPEQATGDATPASDQFAFCVAAWEALFGARPFSGTTLREMRDQASAGRVLRPVGAAVPRRIERALRRGLAARSEDRFASMNALLAAIAPRRGRWVIAVALALVVIAVGAWWLAASRPQADPCVREGNAIFADWTDAARERVRAALGEQRAAQLAHYANAWRDARVALCRAPSTADPAEVERRAARTVCYDRARVELARWLRNPSATLSAPGRTIPLAACDNVALAEAPGTAADPRGCGCPYSPCVEGKCTGECNARAFRMVGPIPGIAVPGRQEALCGATSDGARILYLAGQRCALDHLYIADRVGDRYESFDLSPQLERHDVVIREGCCTISRDGTALLVERKSAPGFIRFPLAGTTIGPADATTATQLTDGTRAMMPVLSRDDRELYFLTYVLERGELYRAARPAPDAPFGKGLAVVGRAGTYENATGISDDGLTLFMSSEWATRALVRESIDEAFGDPAISVPPPRLPGWRAIPIHGCQQLVTTITPGGCESEEPTLFEATQM